MTTCVQGDKMTELEFVQALTSRNPGGECDGPILRITLSPWRLFSLEQCFSSQRATELLWDNHHEDRCLGMHFSLCAAHWFDLCALGWLRAGQNRRSDWASEAEYLLKSLCDAAGWDAKEIVNMFAWQRS